MNLIQFPPKPSGSDAKARFMQWVWESIQFLSRVNDVQGVATQRTTRGTAIIPTAKLNLTSTPDPTTPDKPRWG